MAREFGARAMRVPDEPFWFAARAKRWDAAAGAMLLTPWLMLMKHRLRVAGIFHNDCVFGIAKSGSMDEAELLAILRAAAARRHGDLLASGHHIGRRRCAVHARLPPCG